MLDLNQTYFQKARESLAGAESEYVNRRYNNCANRSYYACFQAAVYALSQAGIRPRGTRAQWGHDFVQAEFIGQLIHRRKVYPTSLREALIRTFVLRQAADYGQESVGETQVYRVLQRASEFVEAIGGPGGGQR
jgi:uncharacterized protein (UPF0332 family)